MLQDTIGFLTHASIFVGHHLKTLYSKFEIILNDSLSLVKLLAKTKIDNDCFLFTVDFQNLYSNISVKDALELLKRLFFKYQNVIPNAHLLIELIELVLNSAVMEFQKVFYKQILGIVMGTNLAPILANIYMAMLEEELKQFITEIQNKLKLIMESHMYKGNCTKKEAEFLMSKMYI